MRATASDRPGRGRVAIVTGASSGIGEATARRLHELGFTVHAGARRLDRMAGLAALGIHVHSLDVTDDDSMRAFVDAVTTTSGRVDVLVNNAGYGSFGAIEEVPIEEARRQFEVNVFGLARMTQLVLPGMRAAKSGCIINVGSMGSHIWEPFGGWYHATKFAVTGLSHSLRAETRRFRIRVVLIEPGAIATEWGQIAVDTLTETKQRGGYEPLASQIAAGLSAMERMPGISGPEVVADAIGRAAVARRPKTRYPVGGGAKPMLVLNAVLPDRAWDVVITNVLRFGAKLAPKGR